MKRIIKLNFIVVFIFLLINNIVVGKQINPFFFYESGSDRQNTRQAYEKNLYNYSNSKQGKDLSKKLSFLMQIVREIHKEEGKEKIKISSKNKKETNKILKRFEDIEDFVRQIKLAIKNIFLKSVTALEEQIDINNIENILLKKTKYNLNKYNNREKSYVEKYNNNTNDDYNNDYNDNNNNNDDDDDDDDDNNNSNEDKIDYIETTDEEETTHANEIKKEEKIDKIILENVIKIIKNLENLLTEDEIDKIIENNYLLLKKLLRPDLILDDKQFNKMYTGLNLQGIKITSTINLPVLNFENSNRHSFLHISTNQNRSSNYCHENDEECDRRDFPDSCESRIDVEDQGGCLSCWVFAGSQCLEIYHCMLSGKDTIYSKQEIIDCSRRGCKGGYLGNIAMYLIDYNRLSDESSYPYEKQQVSCRNNNKPNMWTGNFTATYTGETSHIITKSSKSNFTETEWVNFIKKIVANQGSVVVYLGAYGLRFEPGKAIYMCQTSWDVNHAVIITGWKKLGNVPVWIIRNSWGTWWADNGYAYVAIDGNCRNNQRPINTLHLNHLIRWSDEIPEYKVINTKMKEKKDENLKSIVINIGNSDEIICNNNEHIHIRKHIILNYSRAASDQRICENLNIKKKCENNQRCIVSYDYNMCHSDYKHLYIEYECIQGLTTYDCSSAKSRHNKLTDENCIDFCITIAPKCSPVTKLCLYSHVAYVYCSFDQVIKSTQLGKDVVINVASRFQCDKAIGKGDEYITSLCIDHCYLFGKDCFTLNCLYEKIPRNMCDLSKVTEDETSKQKKKDTFIDCEKATGRHDASITPLCINHCKYFISVCSSLDCLYSKIPSYACNLKNTVSIDESVEVEDKTIVNCDEAIGINNESNTPLCISHCKYYSKYCSTLDCLYKKIPQTICNLNGTIPEKTQKFNCKNAVGTYDQRNTAICIENCEYNIKDCLSLSCLYERIPRSVCDLSKVI